VSLSDGRFHLTGVPFGEIARPFAAGFDVGRMEPTGRESDRYRFRSGPLREIARTAPYMHNGAFESLEDVIAFYTGGSNPLAEADPPVADDVLERGTPRELSAQEIADLVHFLESLSTPADELPRLFPEPESVPSGLPPSAVPMDQRAGLALVGD
jgi:cytochrome c peroxidase